MIDLAVAVIPAERSDVEPDPLFLLAGGPGQAATEVFPGALFLFDEINESRDIVLVDQRGTGGSNPLDCDPPTDDVDGADDDKVVAWAEGCVEELSSKADVRLYTTTVAMADLDDVRRALGYETINLYGGSYGTRAALEYLRRYPEHVRAVIIDSVVPPDLALGTTVARDAQHALDLAFERCAADEQCSEAFPKLEEDFEALLAELDKGPRKLTIDHPLTGNATEVTLKRDLVAGALRFWSYSPETSSLLPLLIHDTVETGDYDRLAEQLMLVGDASANMLNLGMHFSVVCAEDVPFYNADDVAVHNADTYIADFMTDRLSLICDVWPTGEVPADLKTPVESDVPVLILSGEADPVTPPEYGAAVAATLSNSLHLVAPGQGHGVMIRGCVSDLAADFIASGTLEGLDVDCVEELAAPPFFLNYSGPVPEPTPEETEDD
jgi:pimeloyl-ACP methyl ester carboxylesterase